MGWTATIFLGFSWSDEELLKPLLQLCNIAESRQTDRLVDSKCESRRQCDDVEDRLWRQNGIKQQSRKADDVCYCSQATVAVAEAPLSRKRRVTSFVFWHRT